MEVLKMLGRWIRECVFLVTRLLFYIPNLILRFYAIYFLLLAIVASIALLVFLGYRVYSLVEESNYLRDSIPLLGFVVTLGLVPVLLMNLGKKSWENLREMILEIGGIFIKRSIKIENDQNGQCKEMKLEFLPSWKIFPALTKTLAYFGKIPKVAWIWVKKGWRLAVWTTALVILAMMAVFYNEPNDQYHVAVVSASNPQATEIKRYFLEEGTVFSLTHLKNANSSGVGICLDKYHQDWLDAFRRAILECVEAQSQTSEESKLVLQITGFGSSAPSNPGGDEANCEFANMRAEAVASYLASRSEEGDNAERWRCSDMEEAGTIRNAQELCNQSNEPIIYEDDKFKLIVKQWEDARTMDESKPAYDGHESDEQSLQSELFNRSVHIRMPNVFCPINANSASPAEEENHANQTSG